MRFASVLILGVEGRERIWERCWESFCVPPRWDEDSPWDALKWMRFLVDVVVLGSS